jgi:hypothetical protein
LILIPLPVPFPQGRDFVTLYKHSNRILSTTLPQCGCPMWINLPNLSTGPLSYPQNLWISSLMLWTIFRVPTGSHAYRLWINLWIRGAKTVDKPVEKSVENSSLWISRDLSTIHPQEHATYPQFRPQPRGRVFGLSMADSAGYPHIHRPYYYYYSNRYMV